MNLKEDIVALQWMKVKYRDASPCSFGTVNDNKAVFPVAGSYYAMNSAEMEQLLIEAHMRSLRLAEIDRAMLERERERVQNANRLASFRLPPCVCERDNARATANQSTNVPQTEANDSNNGSGCAHRLSPRPVDLSMSGARQPDTSPFWWDKE